MILYIDGCARPESRTRELAKTVLSRESDEIRELRLFPDGPDGLDPEQLALRDALWAERAFDHPLFRWAREFREADTVVLAAPYWDLLFPAKVRAYLEAVMVNHVTFYYDETSIPRSHCRVKKLIYVTTAGGYITQNLGFAYVDALFRTFFGVEETVCVKADGLDILGNNAAAILAEAKAEYLRR